ncbi:MAG: GNAT family N-acetyltransferase [Acidobacteriota bacterium]
MSSFRVQPLDRADLRAAELVLADACAFDRASEVADEKLFGEAPAGLPQAFGAWDGGQLVGVAAVAGKYLRVIAVEPRARHRGAGSALLAACEAAARAAGETRLRALDQPGNYLAPGVDERNEPAIAWLERRGFARAGEPRCNVLIDVAGNPRVSRARADELAAAAAARGYQVRRARRDEHALVSAVAGEFGGAWPFELARALAYDPPGVHVAMRDDAYCAFAAHDGNNSGLGWFGPTGTWPAHRGHGLGEALLVACLVDVATEHARCEVAWIGPRPFYDKVAGIASERRFVALAKDL